jgi:hypothetical protein
VPVSDTQDALIAVSAAAGSSDFHRCEAFVPGATVCPMTQLSNGTGRPASIDGPEAEPAEVAR